MTLWKTSPATVSKPYSLPLKPSFLAPKHMLSVEWSRTADTNVRECLVSQNPNAYLAWKTGARTVWQFNLKI